MNKKLTLLLAALGVLSLPLAAGAQQQIGGMFDPQQPQVVQLNAANAAAVFTTVSGNAYCSANITGTFSGTLEFEQSNDGANWTTAELTVPNVSPSPVPSVTGTYFGTTPMYATSWFRVLMSSYTSGTAIVTVNCVPNAPVYKYTHP